MNKHETHPEIINRLKRASGHLQKVVEMIEKEKGCLEVAQQLQADPKLFQMQNKYMLRIT